MSALKDMKNAMSRLKACRTLLRSARENTKRLDLDHLVLRHMQLLQMDLDALERTAHIVWKAEVRRARETLKHGKTGTGPARAHSTSRRNH